MKVHDLNWMQLEDYLSSDDRIVLPIGSTEQHAYLSLGTDCILAERVSVEAAEPLGVPVLPGAPVRADAALRRVSGEPDPSASRPSSRSSPTSSTRSPARASSGILIVNGHGGNTPARSAAAQWAAKPPGFASATTTGGTARA